MGILDLFSRLFGGAAGFPEGDLPVVEKRWPGAVVTPSGLRYVVLCKGDGGDRPRAGARVKAHYTGTLLSGKKFDSSHDRGKPFEFAVGMGKVIRAWDEALLDMTRGERRTLIIPPGLGYGSRGAGRDIPPDATLVFEVELVDFS